MADQPRETNKPKSDTEKKQPETVLLTAEELRAIAGGASNSSPTPQPKVVVAREH